MGYANGLIEGLGDEEWPDYDRVPTIGKLLNTDYKTLINAKTLLNKAQDNTRLDAAVYREAKALVDGKDEAFVEKMKAYMKASMSKKRQAKL